MPLLTPLKLKIMKKTLLLSMIGLLCLQIQTVMQAQEYVPFPMLDATWTEQNEIYEPPQSWTSLYKTETDTFLLNNMYRNIYEYYIHLNSFDTIRELYASIRQDTAGKKVYVIRHYFSEKQERLLLDFDVNVSDTVILSAYYWDLFSHATDSVYIVDSISETTLNNNQSTNIFHLSSMNTYFPVTLVLIEGVGSLTNPFGVAFGGFNKELRQREFCCPRVLLCLTVAEEQRYVYNDAASCGKLRVWTSIDATYSNTTINIYPNPIKNFCTIKINPENSFEKVFKIYSILGEEMYATRFYHNDMQIDLSSLKPGIYITQIWQKENLVSTQKMIVSL